MVSGKYFNRGVKALDSPDIGRVVRETPDKIVVFGERNSRYDIPISEINQVGANVLINLNLAEIEEKYSVNREDPLPTSRKDPWGSDYFFDPDYRINGVMWPVVGSFGPNRVGPNQYDSDDIYYIVD